MSDEGNNPISVSTEDETLWDQFMQRPTTVPEKLTITMTNFADEADAQTTGEAVSAYLAVFGRIMNLKALDWVYVSCDYEGTLASLDRGVDSKEVLIPTKDDVAVGIAMTPSVKRDGEWKSVIVLNAAYARALSAEPDASSSDLEGLERLRSQVVHTLAHECGHVHDNGHKTRKTSTGTLEAKWSNRDHALMGPACACWDEYIASRLSAGWGNEETLAGFEESFCARLDGAWPKILKSIKQYRMHGDVSRVLSEVTSQIRNVVIYAGYLYGHVDGIVRSLEQAAPKAAAALSQHNEFGEFVVRLHKELDQLFHGYEDFTGLEWFAPLGNIVDEMFHQAGLIVSETNGQTKVSIPLREDTLPNMFEQMEYIKTRNVSQGAAAK